MDNITHTLIGVLVGECAARAIPASRDGLPAQTRRKLFVAAMVVGGNLPDLDFLYSTLTDSKLDYLLHHRGHTHTIIGALVTAVLLLVGMMTWLRWKRLIPSRSDRICLTGVALLAPLLHIAMDLSNNYGVHPLWPFDNRWIYGDSVFIIEPLLWAASTPLVFLLRTRIARALVLAVLAAGVALCFFSGLVPHAVAFAFAVLVGLLLAVSRQAAPHVALTCGVLVWFGATAVFVTASHAAGARMDVLAARLFPEAVLYDHVLTPMPVNPLCWEVILVQGAGDEIVLRRAMFSLAPSWIPARECLSRGLEATAPLQPVPVASDRELAWRGQVVSSRSQLASLVAADFRAAAFMRFARAPWLAVVADVLVVGDLRYDREPELGFAEIALDDEEKNGSRVPPWNPPRRDLLQPSDGSFPTAGAFFGSPQNSEKAMIKTQLAGDRTQRMHGCLR